MVCSHAQYIHVTGVKLKDPGVFAFFAIACSHIRIDGVTVRSWNSLNGDGLDFDGSSDVVISNCNIIAGDDGISIKSFGGRPCHRYVVSGCLIQSRWAAMRLGIDALADMSEITISDCIFSGCSDGLKIQSGEGARFENMRFGNIVMKGVHRPVFMTLSRFRLSQLSASVRPTI